MAWRTDDVSLLSLLSVPLTSLGGFLIIAFGLVVSQRVPNQIATPTGGLDFDKLASSGLVDPQPEQQIAMRDGWDMTVRVARGPQDGPLIVAIHGSGWCGQQFDALGARLSDMATVLAPDLRGHGASPQRRGDLDYIGQMEDDLADLIAAFVQPGQKVILLGHSSGGGLVLRMAGGEHRNCFQAAILLAPFLGYNAPPTTQKVSPWAVPLTRRIVGLSMLNMLRIRALNHVPVIGFNQPQSLLDGPLGHLATTAYSYRLNTSYAPRRNWGNDLTCLPTFLLLAGDRDEAFEAGAYAKAVTAHTNAGTIAIEEGVGHLDLVDAPETEIRIREFLNVL